jgi:hypothetical protein
MAFQNDITVYGEAGQLSLVVEIRNRRGTSDTWAAATRQLLLENKLVVNARYFLLALPDRFYLWVDKRQLDLINPDYSIDPLPFLKPYWGGEDAPEYLTNIGFEMVVEAWLATLTWVDELPADAEESGDWLVESGLFDAIKHGHLASEVTR